MNAHTRQIGRHGLVYPERIRDGYISAMMCLAAQQSIETEQVVKLNLDL